MAIQFPAGPSIGDTFPYEGMVYTYDGEKWTAATGKAYWVKNGDELQPGTAGDDVNLGVGNLKANNGEFDGSITAGGMIETQSGGIKFPDGTTQTTAAAGDGDVSTLQEVTDSGNTTSNSITVNNDFIATGEVKGGNPDANNLEQGFRMNPSTASGSIFQVYGATSQASA